MEKPDIHIIVSYLLGESAEEEKFAVESWINASQDNKMEFEAVKKTWESTGTTADYFLSPDVELELQKYLATIRSMELKSTERSEPERNILWGSWIRVAAIVLISFGMGVFAHYFLGSKDLLSISREAQTEHQVISPRGSKSITILPDGTKVWLNAGTILKYKNDYGIKTRDVELIGEAYFKVTTNPQKPFTVSTSELKIKAWGTAFNVKAYPDERNICATLEEGKIQVLGKHVDITLKPREMVNFERTTFKQEVNQVLKSEPQQNTEVKSTEEPQVETLKNVDTQVITSWKDGKWILESRGLSDISILLERKFNVKVILNSEELLHYKFRGTFTNETLEQILNVFRFTAPINYKIDKGIVTLDIDKNRKKNYQEILTQ